MIYVTPINVTIGKERGQVEFTTETGVKFKLPMHAADAKVHVDNIGKMQMHLVTLQPMKPESVTPSK